MVTVHMWKKLKLREEALYLDFAVSSVTTLDVSVRQGAKQNILEKQLDRYHFPPHRRRTWQPTGNAVWRTGIYAYAILLWLVVG